MECYYCGQNADTVDHVVPQSILEQYKLADPTTVADVTGHGRILTVPACRECNLLASGTYHETLRERKEYIKAKLRIRYRKVLKSPDWEDSDLEELGLELRSHVIASMAVKKAIKARIAW